MSVSFDEAMRAEMARRGITQREAAEQLGVSPQDISFWVLRHRVPSKTRIPKVARWLHKPISEVQQMVDREKLVNQRVDELEERMAGLEKALGELRSVVRKRARG